MDDFRPVVAADLPHLTALMERHVATSMFPLSNLARHGLGGDAPNAVTGICDRDRTGVVWITRAGMVLPQMPAAERGAWGAAAAALGGRRMTGIAGDTAQARAFLAAARLDLSAATIDADEEAFDLPLADLEVPGGPDTALAPAVAADYALLVDWRRAYHHEALGTPPDRSADLAGREIDGYLASGNYRVLLRDGQPVAFTGFNATLPDTVQVGGVYTPPALRGQGFARRAVALHLAEARAQGVRRAVLFAFSPAAIRAYRAIGFRRSGSFTLCLLRAPQEIRPCP